MRQRLIFSAIITIFLSGNIAVLGQCPIPPASITTTISTNNSGTYSLTSNQSLLISGGNFTGKINSVSGSAVIYISPGATFAPTVLGNFLGKIINCGTAILPSFTIGGPSVGIENYNKWTFTGTIGSNEKSYWINGISSKMIFQQSVSMNNVTFTNKGSAKFHGFFTMNAGVNSLVNEDSIIAESINLNSSLNNSGILNSTVGSITLNGVSNTYNNCIIKSNDSFNFSGTDTLINSGTLMLHENNSGVLKFQAKAFKNKSIGFVQGPNFENNGTSVLGSGNFRFTGNTRNQGQFGSDGLGINFYDVSLNSPGIFDVQNIQPHSSVTKISIAKIDTTFFPSTCSNVLKNEVCGQATPITFSSTSPICVGGQSQIVIKGLEAGRKIQAYIGNDSLSSVLTGTGGNLVISLSTYQLKIGYNKITFRLKTAKCGDIYLADSNNIIVNAPPQINLSVIGDTVCQGFPAQVKILQSGTSVNYELFEGAVAISPVTMGNGSTLIFTLLNLSPGIHTITVKATTSGCGAVTLVNQVNVVVNSSPSVLLNVTAQSPVCSSDSVVPVTIHNSSQGAEYYFYLGNHSLGKYLGNGKDLVLQFALAPLKLGSNEITVNTTVTGCITQVLQQNLTIVVNPIPTLFFEATGNTVRYSNDSATVSIKNAPYGAKLEIYKGLTSLLKPLISNGSEVFWKFAVMDTVTKDFFFTVKGQIDGCRLVSYSDTALIKVRRTITSLTEDINSTNLNVFPNPFSSSFTIQSSIPFTKILITNMLGKSVYESYFDSTSEKMISYDFPKGVYSLQLEGNKFRMKKKLVKE